MANQGENNIRLGAFVLTGLLALIFALYMIGQNHNLFGSNFRVRARFSNVNGLIEGDNVLFSGIQAGTIKAITIIDDTTIEVDMLIDQKMKPFLKKNALASIGTQGLMGDKVVNIMPGKGVSDGLNEDDIVLTRKTVSTDELLETLSKTNNNIADISGALKNTVTQFSNSAIWRLINDRHLKTEIGSTLKNIEKTSLNASEITEGVNELVGDIKKRKGTAGLLLKDSAFAANLAETMASLKLAGNNVNNATARFDQMINQLNSDLKSGKGIANLLLADSAASKNLSITMENIRKGTDGFNQNMEALKHNFLFRGYFKNLEKQQQKKSATAGKKP